jgi:hypothetical protein
MVKTVDLTGRQFGPWTVIAKAGRAAHSSGGFTWHVRCRCGHETVKCGFSLRGSKKFAGCGMCSKARPKNFGTGYVQPGQEDQLGFDYSTPIGLLAQRFIRGDFRP